MKYIINERQYKLLTEEQEILHIPSLDVFGNWNTLQKFLERRWNPLYSIGGNLDLTETKIESLGNLISVGGYLDLRGVKIETLGNLTSVGGDLDLDGCHNLTSLGNLTSVEGNLDLEHCKNLTSFGNLTSVGWSLYLRYTPFLKKYSKKEIRQMIEVGGDIYM